MTPRERILTALEHRQPDRVPVDFGGHRSSGISAIAYAKLKKHLGIDSGDIYVYDMVQQLAVIEPEVLDRFQVDTIELGRAFLTATVDWKPWRLPDGTPCKIPAYQQLEEDDGDWYLLAEDGTRLGVQRKGCLYFEQVFWPWEGRAVSEVDLDTLPEILGRTVWTGVAAPGAHLPLTDQGLAELAAGAKRLRETTDRAIVGLFGGNMFEIPQFLFRMDHYLMSLAAEPEACLRLSERLCELHLENLENWLAAVGSHIDVILFGDDLGGQGGPLISRQTYRQLFQPFHRALFHRAKELADVKVQLHCCGGVEPLLGDLIETGLDAINPVQITCGGMTPEHLKKTYGDRLTFWGGGCDTRRILGGGSPDEVRENVRGLVRAFAPGGGFVFQQVHNVMADVPPENVVAMFDAVGEAARD